MGTKERREREKTELRTMIMDAARELFAKEGYDAVSMRRIADVIEYSPTVIYGYFKDKAQLMRDLCNEDFMHMAEEMQQVLQLPDPIERIRQLGYGYIRFAQTHPNHFRLMFMTKYPAEMKMSEEEKKEAGHGDPNQDSYALLKLCVEQAIAQGRLRPEFTDADLVSQLMWSGVHGVASLHITRPESGDWCPWSGAEKLKRDMCDVLFRGILLPGDPALAAIDQENTGKKHQEVRP